MTQEEDQEPRQIDWEWEYLKLQDRIKDCFEEISNIKQLYKKMNARITRMQYTIRHQGEEEEETEEEGRETGLEDLSLEERAIKISELLDRAESIQRS